MSITVSIGQSPKDWYAMAATLRHRGIAPETIRWNGESHDLFASGQLSTPDPDAPPLDDELKQRFALALRHSAPDRFALLYHIVWRLAGKPHLFAIASDPDIRALALLTRAVSRDIHKMHAFVRFRAINHDNKEAFIAWFEPDHAILPLAAPFFVRRFASMRFSIVTPAASAHWDGERLLYGPGGNKQDCPAEDAQEEAWKAYYAAIFNPSRLKIKAMVKEMPRRYWKNMPEAALITPLVRGAEARVQEMIVNAPKLPRTTAKNKPI